MFHQDESSLSSLKILAHHCVADGFMRPENLEAGASQGRKISRLKSVLGRISF